MFSALHTLFCSSWVFTALLGVALVWTLVIIIIILSENRNPVKSLAWVLVLLLLPGLGLLLYIVFGRNINNLRMISRKYKRTLQRRERRVRNSNKDIKLPGQCEQLARLAHTISRAQLYADNSVTVYNTGEAKMEALLSDLSKAEKSIHFQYYIFADDEIGQRVSEVLQQKALSGVKVRVIYDHLGSFDTSKKFFRQLRKAGVEVVPFFRITFPGILSRLNWRNHRKIVVIDDCVAYLGGMNIADRYVDGGSFDMWRDLHVRVTGPIVAAVQSSFITDWSYTSGQIIKPDENLYSDTVSNPGNAIEGITAQIIPAGPTGHWSNVAMIFHKAIASAQKRIFIQTPYFLPTDGLLKALQTAALSGVDVRIMVPRHSDSKMLIYSSASYIEECLKANIKVYFFEPGMLHSKMMLVDDNMVSIGSTNFDFRSFEYNFEINIFCYDKHLNEYVADLFYTDLAMSTRIVAEQWKQRPVINKVAESVARLISPIL